MAKEEEQAREDKKNEHKLDSKKKLELVNKIKEFTSFVKTDDPAENKKLKKAGIKAAQAYVTQERKAMEKLKGQFIEAKQALDTTKPSTQTALDTVKKDYYKAKKIYETVRDMIKDAGQGDEKAKAKVDKAKFTRKLSDEDKQSLKNTVNKYKSYGADSEGNQSDENKKTGDMLLQKLEEDAQFQRDFWKRKMEKDPIDDNKFNYYNALQEYNEVSKEAGENSPAKKAEKKRKVKAAKQKSINEVRDALHSGRA